MQTWYWTARDNRSNAGALLHQLKTVPKNHTTNASYHINLCTGQIIIISSIEPSCIPLVVSRCFGVSWSTETSRSAGKAETCWSLSWRWSWSSASRPACEGQGDPPEDRTWPIGLWGRLSQWECSRSPNWGRSWWKWSTIRGWTRAPDLMQLMRPGEENIQVKREHFTITTGWTQNESVGLVTTSIESVDDNRLLKIVSLLECYSCLSTFHLPLSYYSPFL